MWTIANTSRITTNARYFVVRSLLWTLPPLHHQCDVLPPALTGTTPGDGQVTLRWEPVAGARGYQYRVLEGNRIVKNDWFSASYGTTSSGVVTGLTNGTTYQFQVRAMERGPATRYIEWVGGPWSNGISATPVGPPPAACSGRGLAPHHFLQTQRHPPARAVAA